MFLAVRPFFWESVDLLTVWEGARHYTIEGRETKGNHMASEKPLFSLRLYLSKGHAVIVRAFEGPHMAPNHTRLFCELSLGTNGRGSKKTVLFPRNDFFVGIPAQHSIDGTYAREAVLSLFGMKPGDTDAEFFADYTAAQLAFVSEHADEINMVRESRYCDGNGNVRS